MHRSLAVLANSYVIEPSRATDGSCSGPLRTVLRLPPKLAPVRTFMLLHQRHCCEAISVCLGLLPSVMLRFAKVRAAVLALRPSNAAQAALAQSVRAELALRLSETGALIELDTTGSIGKRYRRQDEVRQAQVPEKSERDPID